MPPTSDLTTDVFVAETLQLAVELKGHAKEALKEIARLAKPAGTSNQLEKTDEGFEQIQEVVDIPESMLLQLRQGKLNSTSASPKSAYHPAESLSYRLQSTRTPWPR